MPKITPTHTFLNYFKSWFYRTFFHFHKNSDSLFKITETECVPDDIDDLLEQTDKSEQMASTWSKDEIIWRCDYHPYFNYKYLSFHEIEKMIGCIIFRELEKTVVIVSIISELDRIDLVLSLIVKYFRNKNITVTYTGEKLKSIFKKNKWYTWRSASLIGSSNDIITSDKIAKSSWILYALESDKDR
jgi:hypothetical protein